MIARIPLSVAIAGLAMMIYFYITGGEAYDETDHYENREERKP